MGSTRLADRAGTEPRAGESEKRVVPYRQTALDRLSSPEQLDQLLVATRPQGWLALAALLVLLASALVWASYGTVTTRITAQGVVIRGAPGSGAELGAVVFLPAAQAVQVETGMEARVALVFRRGSGDLAGTVTEVGDSPVSSRTLARVVADERLVAELGRQGPLVRIGIELRPAPEETGGAARALRIVDGTRVTARILVRREHPIELLVPAAWRSGDA